MTRTYTPEELQDEVKRLTKNKGPKIAQTIGYSSQAIYQAIKGKSPGTLLKIYKHITGNKAKLVLTYHVEEERKAKKKKYVGFSRRGSLGVEGTFRITDKPNDLEFSARILMIDGYWIVDEKGRKLLAEEWGDEFAPAFEALLNNNK